MGISPEYKSSVGFQNIQGFHDKNGCKMQEISKELTNDIEIFVGIWGCKCDLEFEDYSIHRVDPQKHQGVGKGRESGGLIVLSNSYLDKDIKILKKQFCLEVNQRFVHNLNANLLICDAHIPDITSSYFHENIFEEFHRDMLRFCSENTPILITGDMNGRTGVLDDNYIDIFPVGFSLPPDDNVTSLFPVRRNCDTSVDTHRRKIIQFCHLFDLKILNGRLNGDFIGNFTHLNFNGDSSTIDYSLCTPTLYESEEILFVLPQNELSDHSKIIPFIKKYIEIPEISPYTYSCKT